MTYFAELHKNLPRLVEEMTAQRPTVTDVIGLVVANQPRRAQALLLQNPGLMEEFIQWGQKTAQATPPPPKVEIPQPYIPPVVLPPRRQR